MQQATLPQPQRPERVVLNDVRGDLQVIGWDRNEVTAKTDGDSLDLNGQNGEVTVMCDGALILYIPAEASLKVLNVQRDADIRAVVGDIRIDNVGGDLQLRQVGNVNITSVARDLSLRGCEGDFVIASVGDDASLRDVSGSVQISSVGSDFFLRNARRDVSVVTGADAILYVQPEADATVKVQAGDDILLRLPSNVSATLQLQGGSMESIRIDFPGIESGEQAITRTVTLGEGESRIELIAGDDLIVTSRADEWQSMAEFDTRGRDESFPSGEFPGIPADFHSRIQERVEEATRRAMEASRRGMEAGMRGQQQAERVQRKVEAAMRRAEDKVRAAERRAQSMGVSGRNRSIHFERPVVAPAPAAASDPVTEQERLTILKMLQEKKISLDQAEQLLSALEGK